MAQSGHIHSMPPPPTMPPAASLFLLFPVPPWMMNTLSPLAHLEKPHDWQSVGFRSSVRSKTKPPSIATRFPSESRKNFPIVSSIRSICCSVYRTCLQLPYRCSSNYSCFGYDDVSLLKFLWCLRTSVPLSRLRVIFIDVAGIEWNSFSIDSSARNILI